MRLLDDMRKELELKKGQHYIVSWPPLPSNIKRGLEDYLESQGYEWEGGGTASNSSECHWSFRKEE